jgi:hypothetical protein
VDIFPLALDAQTGQPIPWNRAYDPPAGSDADLSTAWGRFLQQRGPALPDIGTCADQIQGGMIACM